MGGGETNDRDLARDNASLREQQRAISGVLRAVARWEGLQPVLDEIVDAARRLCHGEHAQLYMAEGDLFVIFSESGAARTKSSGQIRRSETTP